MQASLKNIDENMITKAERASAKFYKLLEERLIDAPELNEVREILKNIPLDNMILEERRKERAV